MRAHWRYFKYVVLHKLYVFRGGLRVADVCVMSKTEWVVFMWRLIVHDLSKFRPSEWRPYVAKFYGYPCGHNEGQARDRAFNRAWLSHLHRNAHHWQHHVLREDSGKTIVLVMPYILVAEMVADWLGAGSKILQVPTLETCIAETIAWYMANRHNMLLRTESRQFVEVFLHELAAKCGLLAHAQDVQNARLTRDSITIHSHLDLPPIGG